MANKGLRRVSRNKELWNSEEDFAATLVDWLKDLKWEVYQEVQMSRSDSRADIVAVQNRIVWVIETKLSFSLDLLWQARQWNGQAHFVSVAVPKGSWRNSGKPMTEYFCRLMGVGLLYGHRHGYTKMEGGSFDEELPAAFQRRADVAKMLGTLTERHKTFAKAGNSHGLYYSPFRATCEKVAKAVKERPGILMKEVIDSIETHYSSAKTARCSLAKWIEKGVVEGVRSKRDGKFLRLYPTKNAKGAT